MNKEISKIQIADIQELIDNSVTESKTIEYKRELSLVLDSDKTEFLKDVSSFANTLGGRLYFGVEEKDGVPTKIIGVQLDNVDRFILKIDNIIRDCIEPRISTHVHPVKIADNIYVLVVEVRKSWFSPHRVKFKGHDKFYARNSNGAYPLDTSELRNAFISSDSVAQRIKEFKFGRITEIYDDQTPIPFSIGAKIALHFIPLDSFSTDTTYKIETLLDDVSKIAPLYSMGYSHKYNIEGIISYASGGVKEETSSYVQVYRNGIVEVVNGNLLSCRDGQKIIPSEAYEEKLLKFIPQIFNLQKSLGIIPPIYVFMTLLGIKGYEMAVGIGQYSSDFCPINTDMISLPEHFLENFDERPEDILRPMFDIIWNACGMRKSFNFDEENNWIRK